MSSLFVHLCDQICSTSFDPWKKPLHLLLNEMTSYVVLSSKCEIDDQMIISGLQLLLLSDVERIRAASIRALRYCIHRENIVKKFLQYRLDYLICRSLTIDFRNVRERLESYKFIRRFCLFYPLNIPHSFLFILDSILSSMNIQSDQMIQISLELLCEIALSNPYILQECHVIHTMVKYVIHLEESEMIQSIIYSLLHAIDRFTINNNSEPTLINSIDPNGPTFIFVDEGMRQRHHLIRNLFSELLAIFPLSEKDNSKTIDRRRMTPAAYENLTIKENEKMKILKSSTVALITILHSWIGFTAFCQSRNSSVHLLVNCLIVQSEPMKMFILDILYDLLHLDTPSSCNSYQSALQSTYPLWDLSTVEEGYGYVASEGAAKLPRISSTRPNLLDSHMALILLTFIDAGFIEAITEIASSDNTILSIRATLLLANFIWLCNEHLPEEQSFLLLPLLMDIAIADDDSVKRSFAKEAMFHLNSFFEFNKRTSSQHSFQLAQLISHSQHLNDYFKLTSSIPLPSTKIKSNLSSNDPLVAERIDHLIGETNTLQKENYHQWNWDLILSLLKDFPQYSNQIQGDLYERFLDKLYDFFKVDQKNGFNSIELTDYLSYVTCRCLMALADLLLSPSPSRSLSSSNHIKFIASNIVQTLIKSIYQSLKQTIIAMKEGIGQSLMNEEHLSRKNTVYYYLFLGRLTQTSFGTEILANQQIFTCLLEMLKLDDYFLQSIVVALSSLNYYYDGPPRQFLIQTLKSPSTALRLYSTSLLRVILRCNPVSFGQWGLNLLCTQLHDRNENVILESVSILDEALEDKRLVQIFSKQWNDLSSIQNQHSYLNDIYHLFSARLCSIPLNQFQHDDKYLFRIREELSYWDQSFNRQYVIFMETRLFSAYSGDALLTDECFQRRKSSSSLGRKSSRKRLHIHVSPHIYRQLCLHQDGFLLLCSQSRLEEYALELKEHPTNCINLEQTQTIKEALWALAHTASTEYGYSWFNKKDLLADFLRFAEECQNLSVRGTAFYGLSLIAQTPDGAMSLKDFGWETYRVRAHSIPSSVVNTDTYQCVERRMTKINTLISTPISILKNPFQQIHLSSNDHLVKEDIHESEDSVVPDIKSRRSLTMPSSISLNPNDKSDIRHDNILEENGSKFENNITAIVSFPGGLEPGNGPVQISVPVRRSSSISKELANLSIYGDSTQTSGRTESFSEIESIRSSTYDNYPYNQQQQQSLTTVQSITNSLPLERHRPRSKSAHHSQALRLAKRLKKVPEVIKTLRAPTATSRNERSQTSTSEELHRSRLLRCNFLLKPDAAGYEYARRVQEISHATYNHLKNNSNDLNLENLSMIGRKEQILSPFSTYRSKFYHQLYQPHYVTNQHGDKFTTDDGKFSFEQRDFDDADEDGNTIYRGLAVPVDIRQVIEISDGYNLNCETWSDLVLSRSRANTNAEQIRTRSATNESNHSEEFVTIRSPSPPNVSQDQILPSTCNQSSTTLNICMMCEKIPHDDSTMTMSKDFIQIQSLSSRLIASVHREEIEKELLRLKESEPQLFDNICLYSEICSLLTLSHVRIGAQRFLHDLFSDCQFQKLRKRRREQINSFPEEDEEEFTDNS